MVAAKQIAEVFNCAVTILTPVEKKLQNLVSIPFNQSLSSKDISIAQWVYDKHLPAGKGTDTLSSNSAVYLPLMGSVQIQGVIRIDCTELFTPEKKHF